jgi:thiosulfate/3-mercaptopyruvate sulfurtransferase
MSRDATPLINAKELYQLFNNNQKVVIIGVIPPWRFLTGHIPGSHQVWRQQLSQPGSAKLIHADGFTRWAQQRGINTDSRIVIWDERYDATRLWWAFRHYGKQDVQILNGGLHAWKCSGLPVELGPTNHSNRNKTGNFIGAQNTAFPIANSHHVLTTRTAPDSQLWDCRHEDEWSGMKRLRGAKVAGRIPWAMHLPWQLFRAEPRAGGLFHSIHTIEKVIKTYGVDRTKKQYFYCQSGVRTTVAIFALYRMGWDPQDLINYDGSWREWSHDVSLPSTSKLT